MRIQFKLFINEDGSFETPKMIAENDDQCEVVVESAVTNSELLLKRIETQMNTIYQKAPLEDPNLVNIYE